MALKSIASASSISLLGVNSAEITGTATISTFTDIHDGQIISLMAGGAFALAGGGNIVPITGTATVNKWYLFFVRNSIAYELAVFAPLGVSFVTASSESQLPSERILAGENTVLSITDGGAGGNITVGVASNGITDAKLRQGVATSVIGRGANSTGNVADIAASASGDVLWRSGSTLGFGALTVLGTVATYSGITTAGLGVPVIVARAFLTGQTTSLALSTLYTTPAAGEYVIQVYWRVTTAGTGGTINFTYQYTDEVGLVTVAGTTQPLNTVGSFEGLSISLHVANGAAIKYGITLTGATGSPQFQVSAVLLRLS